jgi:hypothetical protein
MTKEPFMVSWQAFAISIMLWLIIVLVVYGAWQ